LHDVAADEALAMHAGSSQFVCVSTFLRGRLLGEQCWHVLHTLVALGFAQALQRAQAYTHRGSAGHSQSSRNSQQWQITLLAGNKIKAVTMGGPEIANLSTVVQCLLVASIVS